MNKLLRSTLRTKTASALACAAFPRSFPENLLQVPLWSRSNSAESSLAKDNSTTDVKTGQGRKGHDMLAPFTAGWQADSNPLIIEKSEGSYLYDINGKKYLDPLAGLWCTALGGNESRLVDAATAQLKKLPFYHSFWNRTTRPSLMQDLAKDLLEFFTARKMPKAFFVNSGSEANDTQPDFASQFEDKNVHSEEDTNELVLDGGFPLPKHASLNEFIAPEINSSGHSFRNYDAESERQKGVEEFYRLQHINQTYDFVKRMREEYKKLDKAEMSIWECCGLLNEVVDESDPDLDEPQIQHLLQSAEAIRKDYPDEDWLHLTALIHDLGKILLLPQFGELPQWAVVGDTFPIGCAFDKSNVHQKYFKDNPDSKCPAYNTKNGIYTKACGLDNVMMSWGHDDYMYLVAKENGTTLLQAGLFIIRYHSFYPLHKEGAYTHLMNEEDFENLKWLHIFNKYDLYSKSKVLIDVEKVKPYYLSLIEKYFPAKLRW